jgi:hypothetical protein
VQLHLTVLVRQHLSSSSATVMLPSSFAMPGEVLAVPAMVTLLRTFAAPAVAPVTIPPTKKSKLANSAARRTNRMTESFWFDRLPHSIRYRAKATL